MLTALLIAALAGAQPATEAAEAEDPYNVADPFAIESAPPAPASAPEAAPAEPEVTPPPSGERLICRSKLRLGSRLVRERTCLTADQWRIYESDMEQSRRDIADRGARGCDPTTMRQCFR